MLDRFRSQTGSFITYLLFSMIIIVFVFTFGVMSPDEACGSGAQVADLADVNGRDVSNLDVGMASAVVDAKVELERIREQVQNIE